MPRSLADWRAPHVEDGYESTSPADVNNERLLMLLSDADMTIAALRERGVRSPAKSLYDLRVAGYSIDRINILRGGERPSVQYRLNTGHLRSALTSRSGPTACAADELASR